MTVGIALQAKQYTSYPYFMKAKDVACFDYFDRATLNPTNAIAYYVATPATAGTAITNSDNLVVTTAAVDDDYIDLKCSEFALARTSLSGITGINPSLSTGNRIRVQFEFHPNESTQTAGFVGLVTPATLTAIPSTARHLGITWDTDVDANMYITSSNGTTQVKTTAITLATTARLVDINWTGLNTATITVYTASTMASVMTENITAIGGNNDTSLEPHWFCQSRQVTTAKNLIGKWWGFKPY